LQPPPKTAITIISRTGKATDFKFGWEHSQGPSEQTHNKHFGEKGAWTYPGTAQIFWVPPVISGTGNATNFKFCKHIYSIHLKKSPLKISGKVAMGMP